MKYMVIICITTSIILTFNTHGKYSISQAYHLNYDAIINIIYDMEFIIVDVTYKGILETCPISSNITN